MNDPAHSPGSSPKPANWLPDPDKPKKRSAIVPALITLCCAVLLTFGSFFGFASTCGNFSTSSTKEPLNTIFLWATLAGVALFLVSAFWVVVAVIWTFFTAGKKEV